MSINKYKHLLEARRNMKTVMKAVSVFFGILLACILIFPISAANCMAAQSIDKNGAKSKRLRCRPWKKLGSIQHRQPFSCSISTNRPAMPTAVRDASQHSPRYKSFSPKRGQRAWQSYIACSGGADTADIAIEVSHVDGEPIVTSALISSSGLTLT